MTGHPGRHRVPPVISPPNPAPLLIAVDPGLSTGVAVVYEDRSESFTSVGPDHSDLEQLLNQGVEVVCERGPVNRRQADACVPIETLVKQRAKRIHWVRPSDWKPSPYAKLCSGDSPRTKHERDATRMGRWFLAQRGRLLATAQVEAA